MFKMYGKWDQNPVTIVYGSDLMPISTIPFPAITICPLSKSREGMLNLTWALDTMNHNYTMLDDVSEKSLRAIAHVCPFQKHWKKFPPSSGNENIIERLRTMARPLEDVMIKCWWRTRDTPCKTIMIERLLDDGICYTFNSLALDEIYKKDQISPDFLNFSNVVHVSDWTREGGYRPGAGFNAYPHRPLSNGQISGIVFAAAIRQEDQEPFCSGTHTGFKFAVHAPDEVPLTEERFYRWNNMSAAVVTISPEVIDVSEKLKSVDPFKRNCFFVDERPLQFFHLYNQMNCAFECIANHTLVGLTNVPINYFPIKMNFMRDK
ncbi:pickpocket protein 28-like [Armigeres subalbatus]|uniref:pickpocket protein 28-like n=1 Tax=Armigeres subalbatus TaxID=124917 RepID=UPI002ED26C73